MAADERDTNRDPLSEEPGSHPVGTGVGAAGGAAAGVAAGMMGGPVGMAVGGVVGAVVGGLAGRALAEAMDPTAEEAHWRENYRNEPYYQEGRSYDDYAPAYRAGMESRARYPEHDWDTTETRLRDEWPNARGSSSLEWDQARSASRAAWDRVGSGSSSGSASMMGSDNSSGMSSSGMSGSGSSMSSMSGTSDSDTGTSGSAASVGEMQSAGNDSGDREDVIDVVNSLVETSLDGEYGFRTSAEQVERPDLKSMLLQRADDCGQAARELQECVRQLGGDPDQSGSASGAVHRGWVAVKSTLSTYDDKAVIEECERGEDNALARYRKAMQKPLPEEVRQLVERQLQGVQRNHDQIKMLRDQLRAAS